MLEGVAFVTLGRPHDNRRRIPGALTVELTVLTPEEIVADQVQSAV
jgi:hypothetical protein